MSNSSEVNPAAGQEVPLRLKGVLSVTALEAKDLPREWLADFLTKSDPYLVIALNAPYEKGKPLKAKEQDQHIQRTTISNLGGKHPIWNERFALPVPTVLKTLHVEAFDADLIGEDFMGAVDIDLSNRDLDDPWIEDVWHELEDNHKKKAGKVHLIIHYVPQTYFGYLQQRANHEAAEIKRDLTRAVVAKVTDITQKEVNGYFGG
ncbi:C2 domain-containing protein [Jimgerdemannia flammicorona]|uniref:C2 domain-containing protein n=1 Tax=Jimgerdemannia flammicorona TaxID=994334 RepID=A0A433DKB2_9FUNG|nr:C2 domain-containing protein [Jimgerdemannia flammicorona]